MKKPHFDRQIFYVKKKPDHYFPHEPGSVFTMSGSVRKYEYSSDGGMVQIIPEDMPGYFTKLTQQELDRLYKVWSDLGILNLIAREVTAEKIDANVINSELWEKPPIPHPPRTKPVNFESIRKDYQQHGYLEDWQVEWLINDMADLLTVLQFLTDIAKQNNIVPDDQMEISISRDFYEGLIQKIKQERNAD